MDEVLKGYRLQGPFRVAGGGQCEWTFAEKGGNFYFLKKFLEPKYPVEGSPGSPKTRERQSRRCMEFENHQNAVLKALKPLVGSGGNLVVPAEFFRVATTYYKSSVRVDTNVTAEDLSDIPLQARLIILLTVCASLRTLHSEGLVHGDIKPPNILITQTADRYVSKLIDFDDCFRVGQVPPPESLVGDFKYYSPELGEYISNEEEDAELAAALTPASDIYALGLVFHNFLTGKTVPVPAPSRTAWQATTAGTLPPVDVGEPALNELLNEMLQKEPYSRPSASQVFKRLKDIQRSVRSGMLPVPARAADAEKTTTIARGTGTGELRTSEGPRLPDVSSSGLRIKMSGKPTSSTPAKKSYPKTASSPAPDTSTPRLKIKGLRQSLTDSHEADGGNPGGI